MPAKGLDEGGPNASLLALSSPHPESRSPPPTLQENEYEIPCEHDLGDILLVCLHKEPFLSLNLANFWYCNSITVLSPSRKAYIFPCYQWIEGRQLVELREGTGRSPLGKGREAEAPLRSSALEHDQAGQGCLSCRLVATLHGCCLHAECWCARFGGKCVEATKLLDAMNTLGESSQAFPHQQGQLPSAFLHRLGEGKWAGAAHTGRVSKATPAHIPSSRRWGEAEGGRPRLQLAALLLALLCRVLGHVLLFRFPGASRAFPSWTLPLPFPGRCFFPLLCLGPRTPGCSAAAPDRHVQHILAVEAKLDWEGLPLPPPSPGESSEDDVT